MAADAVGVDGRGAAAAGPQCGVPGIPRDGGGFETEKEVESETDSFFT